jgi:hypothetical protein
MPTTPLSVVILASGLKGTVGHNLGYTTETETALREAGAEVAVLAHKDLAPELATRPGWAPAFTQGTYDFPPGKGPWRDLAYMYGQSTTFVRELRVALEGRRCDVLFCHTVADMELIALSRFVAAERFQGCLAVMERNTPGFGSLERWKLWLHPYMRMKPRYLNLLSRHLRERFVLLTDSDLLSADYRRVVRAAVVTAPIPLGREILRRREHPSSSPHPGANRRRVGYLGDSRNAKGFALLPGVIRRMLAAPDCQFVVQCAANAWGAVDAATERELIHLREANPSRINLVRDRLNDAQFAELLDSLDVVLCPYTHPHFREGTSNVFTEAVALGKPTVVPLNTWMASEQGQSRGGVAVKLEIDAIASGLQEVLDEYATFAARAQAFAPTWRERHHASALAKLLLGAFPEPARMAAAADRP